MTEQTAVIIGASGLIGSNLLLRILDDNDYKTVRVLVRKPLGVEHPKLQQEIVDFDDTGSLPQKLGTGDSIFCCIGTTQKKVGGDKIAYEKIDHDIPVNIARAGSQNGFKNFLIVSSAGAGPSSSNFYLSLKGRTERDITFPFKSISIFRPSMLLGKRTERRPAEKIAQVLMKTFSFLFLGRLQKYHPVKAEDVAQAMIEQSKKDVDGIFILGYKEIIGLSGN